MPQVGLGCQAGCTCGGCRGKCGECQLPLGDVFISFEYSSDRTENTEGAPTTPTEWTAVTNQRLERRDGGSVLLMPVFGSTEVAEAILSFPSWFALVELDPPMTHAGPSEDNEDNGMLWTHVAIIHFCNDRMIETALSNVTENTFGPGMHTVFFFFNHAGYEGTLETTCPAATDTYVAPLMAPTYNNRAYECTSVFCMLPNCSDRIDDDPCYDTVSSPSTTVPVKPLMSRLAPISDEFGGLYSFETILASAEQESPTGMWFPEPVGACDDLDTIRFLAYDFPAMKSPATTHTWGTWCSWSCLDVDDPPCGPTAEDIRLSDEATDTFSIGVFSDDGYFVSMRTHYGTWHGYWEQVSFDCADSGETAAGTVHLCCTFRTEPPSRLRHLHPPVVILVAPDDMTCQNEGAYNWEGGDQVGHTLALRELYPPMLPEADPPEPKWDRAVEMPECLRNIVITGSDETTAVSRRLCIRITCPTAAIRHPAHVLVYSATSLGVPIDLIGECTTDPIECCIPVTRSTQYFVVRVQEDEYYFETEQFFDGFEPCEGGYLDVTVNEKLYRVIVPVVGCDNQPAPGIRVTCYEPVQDQLLEWEGDYVAVFEFTKPAPDACVGPFTVKTYAQEGKSWLPCYDEVTCPVPTCPPNETEIVESWSHDYYNTLLAGAECDPGDPETEDLFPVEGCNVVIRLPVEVTEDDPIAKLVLLESGGETICVCACDCRTPWFRTMTVTLVDLDPSVASIAVTLTYDETGWLGEGWYGAATADIGADGFYDCCDPNLLDWPHGTNTVDIEVVVKCEDDPENAGYRLLKVFLFLPLCHTCDDLLVGGIAGDIQHAPDPFEIYYYLYGEVQISCQENEVDLDQVVSLGSCFGEDQFYVSGPPPCPDSIPTVTAYITP